MRPLLRAALVAAFLLTTAVAVEASSNGTVDRSRSPGLHEPLEAEGEPPAFGLLLLGLAGLAAAGSRYGGQSVARPHPRRLRTAGAGLCALLGTLWPGSAGATPILSEVFFNALGADDQKEWVEIYNDGASAVDLSGYSLGWGGPDYTTGTLQLSGTLLPGQYFVVGGPTSDASNGNPVFDLALDFAPDLENSGIFAAADGVALFDVVATAITAATVPIDAFIYAGPFLSGNFNDLIDETGAPGTVDFVQPFAAPGYSAAFDGTGWQTQAAPSPGTGTLPAPVPEPGTAATLLLGLTLLATRRSPALRRASPAIP